MIQPGRYEDLRGVVIDVHADQTLTVHYGSHGFLTEDHPDPRFRLSEQAARLRRDAITSGQARKSTPLAAS